MARKISHTWSPIEDLPMYWQLLAHPEVKVLVEAWLTRAESFRRSAAYETFLLRIRREWAIETGAIEGLYQISDAATRTLIEQGFEPDLLFHEDVGRSPDEVISIIKDQHEAIAGLYQFASGDRDLSKSYVRELHQVLTANQPTYEAIDTLGNRVERELPRGRWKTLPNNVGDPKEGYYFEFCPPEQVDVEVERLLQFHREHERVGVPPDLEAAWIHHRFTLIHPFADGNGRVARCLATLILLKARWLPLIVTRQEDGYIDAIREADQGNLKPLVDLFAELQNRTILKAFGLSDELPPKKDIGAILESVRTRLGRSRPDERSEASRVLATGNAIHRMAAHRLEKLGVDVDLTIRDLGAGFRASTQTAEGDNPESWRQELFGGFAGSILRYLPNFQTFRAWTKIVIDTNSRTEILFALHGIGREFTGVLGVYAVIFTKHEKEERSSLDPIVPLTHLPDSFTIEVGPSEWDRIEILSNSPFSFTYLEPISAVVDRFRPWLEDQLIRGLDNWRKRIGA